MRKSIIAFAALAFFAMTAKAQPKWFESIKFSGYGMVQYQASDKKDAETNSFNLRLVRLALEGRVHKDFYWKAQMQINVAIDEIFSNISHYAYPGSEGEATVRFEYDPQAKEAKVCFRDHGVPYNSLNKSDPDVTLPAVERSVGGLGIFLVKKLMDRITYEYTDGMNVLCIIKKVG